MTQALNLTLEDMISNEERHDFLTGPLMVMLRMYAGSAVPSTNTTEDRGVTRRSFDR